MTPRTRRGCSHLDTGRKRRDDGDALDDRKPKVFLSHSSHDEAATRMLEALEAALEAANYDVLLDKTDLKPGMEWPDEIRTWINTCHAAVVVLSEAAIASAWVLSEATVLMQRRFSQPSFVLVPVFLPPVTGDSLKGAEKWTPIDLHRVQGITCDDADAIAEDLLERLEPVMARYGPRSPTHALEVELAERLRQLGDKALADVAETLGLDLSVWVFDDKPTVVAQRMLDSKLPALYDAADLLKRLGGSPRTGLEVYKLAAPYAWVPAEAVGQLIELAAARSFGLNSTKPLTCRMYVRRARHTWKTVELTGGWSEEIVNEVLQETRSAVKDALGYDPEEDVSDQVLDAELRAQPADRTHFLIVPYPAPDAEVVDALRKRLPLPLVLPARR
jgi:hypothetical protein